MSYKISKLPRYVKVPNNDFVCKQDGSPLLKRFDSRNFALIDMDLLEQIKSNRRQKHCRTTDVKFNNEDKEVSKPTSNKGRKASPPNSPSNNKGPMSHASPPCMHIDLGLKSVVVARNPSQSNYSLRATRRKITASNDDDVVDRDSILETMKQNTEELWTNFGTNVKAAKLNFMKITTANRKVRYGWYNNSSSADEFNVVKKEDLEYQLKDPEERVRFNENKAWAGKFVLCPGQKTLCRLL